MLRTSLFTLLGALASALDAPIAATVLLAELGLRVRDAGGRVAAPGHVLLALAPRLLRGLSLLVVALLRVFGTVSAISAGHEFLFPPPSEGVIQ